MRKDQLLLKIKTTASDIIYHAEVLDNRWSKVESQRLRVILNQFRKDIIDLKRQLIEADNDQD